MYKKITRVLSILLCSLLVYQQVGFAQVAGQLDIAGRLAGLGSTFTQDKFRPLHLRYFSYDTLNDNFKVLLDKGDVKQLEEEKAQEVTKTLLSYFLIGVTLPDSMFWVNLRPDSEDQIIDPYLEKTDVGKIMLEADLQLKKDTASFTSPQTPEGKKYWDKLYKKAAELYGYDNVTIPTLTRPWIVPGEIIVRESKDSAYVYKATLKVMLEQDYLKDSTAYNFKDERSKALNEYSSQLIRELIIPKLTKEVNSSKRYANLRQVYYSLILARWFKLRFSGKSGTYSQLINTTNLTDLTSQEPWSKNTYFKQYQKSFSKGEYSIQESVATPTGQVIRSYFSGGEDLTGKTMAMPTVTNPLANGDIGIFSTNQGYPAIPIKSAGLIAMQGNGGPSSITLQPLNEISGAGPSVNASSKISASSPVSISKLLISSLVAINLLNPGLSQGNLYAQSAYSQTRAVSSRTIKEIKKLIQLFNDKDIDYSRLPIVESLVKIGEPAIGLLIEALSDPNENVRNGAAAVLVKIGKPAIEPLIALLGHSNPNMRGRAAHVLGDIRNRKALEPLIRNIGDSDPSVRREVYYALGRIGTAPAVEALLKAVTTEPDKKLKGYVIGALGDTGVWVYNLMVPEGGLYSEFYKEMATLIDPSDERQGAAAFSQGREFFGYQALPLLIYAMSDSNSTLVAREYMIETLGLIGDNLAVEPLIRILNDPQTPSKLIPPIIKALSQMLDPRIVEPLTKILNDPKTSRELRTIAQIGLDRHELTTNSERFLTLTELVSRGDAEAFDVLLDLALRGNPDAIKSLNDHLVSKGYTGDKKSLKDFKPVRLFRYAYQGSTLAVDILYYAASEENRHAITILIALASEGNQTAIKRLNELASNGPWMAKSAAQLSFPYYINGTVTKAQIEGAGLNWRIFVEIMVGNNWGDYKAGVFIRLNKKLDRVKDDMSKAFGEDFSIILPILQNSVKSSSSPMDNQDQPDRPGGIDFRTLPMSIQLMGNFSGLNFDLPRLSQAELERINVDSEVLQIQNMVQSGIVPSGERIKELVAACMQKKEINSQVDNLLLCLVDILKLEEENASESVPELREALVIVDSQI